MSISGNESTILWFRGSVLLVLIPPLPPGPAHPPPSPPQLTPRTYSDVSKSRFALQNTSEMGEKKQPTEQEVRSAHPHTAPMAKGHRIGSPRPNRGGTGM